MAASALSPPAAEVARRAAEAGISAGEPLVVGVSGGADSVALLRLLVELPAALRPRPVVAHFDHGLRPGAAEADRAFVARLAERLGLPFRTAAAPPERPPGLSVEMAAREQRLAFLRGVAAHEGARLVALGHHRRDQAETVLLRLVRGTGVEGLAAMRHLSPDGLWRPLLSLDPAALRRYLATIGQDYRTDLSNLAFGPGAPERNRIRHEALPILEAVRPGAAVHLAWAADAAADAAQLVALALEHELPVRVARRPGGPWCAAPAAAWRRAAPPLRRAWLRAACTALGRPSPPRDWVAAWATAPDPAPRPQQDAIDATWQEDGPAAGVILAPRPGVSVDGAEVILSVPGRVAWPFGGWLWAGTAPPPAGTPESMWAAPVPAPEGVVRLRPPRPGDRLITTTGARASAREALRRAAVPVLCRRRVPAAVAAEGNLVWLAGVTRRNGGQTAPCGCAWVSWVY